MGEVTDAVRTEKNDPLRRRLAAQRRELKALNRSLAAKERYVREAAAIGTGHWKWRQDAEERFLETTCPWCRMRRGLRIWSYQWRVWRWIVLFTGGSFGYRLQAEYERGRRDARRVTQRDNDRAK